jgi:DNA-binding response OmpR family regulator
VSADLMRRQILLVEDQDMLREMIVDVLSPLYEVTWTARISTTLERLREQHFDLVLLDWELPDGYGCDVIEQNRLAGTAVIWMSGDADSITSGLRGTILRKPFLVEDLLAAVSEALGS